MKVTTKKDVMKLLRNRQSELEQFGVNRLGLFGSFVRDTASKESDVDVLVVFESSRKTFDNFMNLSFFLEGLLGRKVDLVTIDSLSPYIEENILREVEYV
ncbi:putative nucleotidyltransferase [Xenococcus sp. PCC 7305]|uniref:nucleotidyltransferase family protein n=1 Tax=Xenococcus sp. PCC 7305 TaxID=102125 RepID=UPI0002AD0EDC|nr:nucleotidyltransferase family protein [Xenococcus sp. PCC 7305]ELS05645.1 putative nucleotidyltransferase [Xenococcus sp. PCC 7305]